MVARIWANCNLIHVLIGGTRVKTVRSHLSVNDFGKLVAACAGNNPLICPRPCHPASER
jgi:hypothetical protein